MSSDNNFNRIDLTFRLGGDKKTTDEVLVIFVEELQEMLQQIQDDIDKRDYNSLFSVAHTLKGTAANVGAVSISAIAANMQKAAENKSDKEIDQVLDSLLLEAASIIAIIKYPPFQ